MGGPTAYLADPEAIADTIDIHGLSHEAYFVTPNELLLFFQQLKVVLHSQKSLVLVECNENALVELLLPIKNIF
jgi:hypothetical protein